MLISLYSLGVKHILRGSIFIPLVQNSARSHAVGARERYRSFLYNGGTLLTKEKP
jgi:hypothetical protein